jgi:hypothetical protein
LRQFVFWGLPAAGADDEWIAIWTIAHRLCRLVWKTVHEGVQYNFSFSDPSLSGSGSGTPGEAQGGGEV